MVSAIDSRLAWKSADLIRTSEGLEEIADTLDGILCARLPGGMKFRYLEFDVDASGAIDVKKRLKDKVGWNFSQLGVPLHPEAHISYAVIKAARIECQQRPPHLKHPLVFKHLDKHHSHVYHLEDPEDEGEVILSATEYLELQDLRFVVLGFNCHNCIPATCFKGGRQECRFKFPFKLQPRTCISVKTSPSGASVKVDVDLKRNHAYVNSYNPAMAMALRGNHDIKYTAVRNSCLYNQHCNTNP